MKSFGKIAAAALLAMAGALSLLLVSTDVTDADCFLFFVRDVLAALAGRETLAALLFTALWALFARTLFAPALWRRGDRLRLTVMSAAFACVAAVSGAYRADDGSMAGFVHPWHLLLLAGKAVGFFALFFLGMKALVMRLPALGRRWELAPAPDERALRRFFLLAWAAILLAWLPAILTSYPGALSVDAGRALQQFTGEIPWTADHPPAYTLLLGATLWLGSRLGGDQFGLFLCTLAQALFLSGVMAYSAAFLRREGVLAACCRALVALYALMPLAMLNAAHIIKDVPYAAAFFAYCLCMARAWLHPEAAFRARGWWAGTLGFSLLMLLLRHNGVLVVLPTATALAVLYLRRCGHGALRRARAALLLTPLLLQLAFTGWIVPLFAYQPESTPDVLGVAFQQTARILKNSPQDVTAADRATIDRLLTVDALADSYAPTGSDAVRKTFRYGNDHTPADILRFAGVWAKLAAQHPMTAFHAFWSLSGGFVDPFDVRYAYVGTMPEETSAKYPHAFHFAHPEAVLAAQPRWDSAMESYRALPLVSQLGAIGLYAWLLLIGWFLIVRTGERRLAWLLLPPGMTLLACLFSAGYQTGGRYALPMVYTAPFFLLLLGTAALRERPAGAPTAGLRDGATPAREGSDAP